ncbi:MAG: glycosyl hydrolase 108 family protein [Cetobacterium sp.]|uniref:glycoside hydrolase family 108 protein n=1 Tax=Cetobacterium sp. TaxID=2071632 RepID=UPI002FCA8D1E
MSYFEKCFEETLLKEGGYSYHKNDTGGETMFGITKEVAIKNGYYGNMKDLPLPLAKKIYKKDYWDINKLDEIKNIEIACEIFDTGVNCGVRTAAKFMQEAYNLLTPGNKLVTDGIIGKNTIKLINEFNKPERILKLSNALQAEYYLKITRNREANESFIFGWLDKRVKI